MSALSGIYIVVLLLIMGSLNHLWLLNDVIETEEVQKRIKKYEEQYRLEMEQLHKGFVKSFVDNPSKACQNPCQQDTLLILGHCVDIGSQFEKWSCKTPLSHDILVPMFLQGGYSCKPEICCCDILPDHQSYGRILMVSANTADLGCRCETREHEGAGLWHVHRETFEACANCLTSIMCSERYLDAKKLVEWFRNEFAKSWIRIDQQYDFELTFCGLKIHCQSGRTIHINVFPSVRLMDSEIYLVSGFTGGPRNTAPSTVNWHISRAVCEKWFLETVVNYVPRKSCHLKCLELLMFLSGKLRSSSDQQHVLRSYLWKTALMHQLLHQPFSNWHECHLQHSLRDVLEYLGRCLDEKRLHPFVMENHIFPKQIPEILLQAEPINLFQSLVANPDSYNQTLMEYWKILRYMAPLMMGCIKSNPVNRLKTFPLLPR